MSEIRNQINEATKLAMRNREKPRVACLRLVNAEIKSVEVERRGSSLDDGDILVILRKMIKQRKDSVEQFTAANRLDLATQEEFEVAVINEFMPDPLTPEKVEEAVLLAISDAGAETVRDMGKVMNLLGAKFKGVLDMGLVSKKVKEILSR